MKLHLEPAHASEPFPQVLEDFIKNNPNMKCENLYLCESIDVDGNVVDTKIGVNLLTNYGLKDHFVDGNSRYTNMYIWLGSGQTEPDPTSASLTTYISSLGQGSGYEYWSNTFYEYTFDQETLLWSVKNIISKNYWDYTAGSNGEYEIWELGLGHSQTALRTHALIYDGQGQQTCIVKRPNTRLYITAYWVASVSMAEVPEMYKNGKYLYIDPHMAMPNYGYKTVYWSNLTRGKLYNNDANYEWSGSRWSWNTHTYTNLVTNDARQAHMELGPSDHSAFWEADYLYSSGWLIAEGRDWGSRYQTSLKDCGYYAMMIYDLLPEPEEMESYWAYTNYSFTYILSDPTDYTNGVNTNHWSFLRLDGNFGGTQAYRRTSNNPTSWSSTNATFPCTDFHITELTMYNHTTKEWDIPVPYKDEPNTIYCDHWMRFYQTLWIKYKGNSINVYVFINMFPHDSSGTPIPKILSFNNSNMVLAGTDAYWDPSTYVEIPNLNSVPVELQQKRYYVVVSGTVAELAPSMSRADWFKHELRPVNSPFELTHETTGIIPRMLKHDSYTSFASGNYNEEYSGIYTYGCIPLVSNTKKFFCINWMLVFCDENWNVTRYNLLLEDKYPGCRYRRYMTADCDRILWFTTRVRTNLENETSGSNNTTSYAVAANRFSIWTIVDANTTPTRVDLDLSTMWTDTSLVNNEYCYHRYSWSDVGYLVVAKRRTEPEFVYVDIYGTGNGPEMHLVTNAKHARAIEHTQFCIYQDMNLTEGSKYVFNIFDMSSGTVDDTITIDDGTTYTINGTYGYNEHVYIRVKSSANLEYTYYYNRSTHSLEKLTDTFQFMLTDMIYWAHQTTVYDDYCIMNQGHESSGHTYIIHGNEWHRVFPDGKVSNYASYQKSFACLNTINDGKQLLMGLSGRSGTDQTSYVLDLGLLLDSSSKTEDYVPYGHFGSKDCTEGYDVTGPIIPYNDGILVMSGAERRKTYGSNTKLGRIWWFPPEMCLRLHMKGTTRTLNSYNAPIKWYLTKKVKWDVTNDLSRLLPQNNVGE